MASHSRGFTFLEIMIVVATIGLLCAMAIPAFLKSRSRSQATVCINMLRLLDSGKEQCAMDMRWSNGTPVVTGDSNVNMYIKVLRGTTNSPLCPAGGTYYYNKIGTDPTCSAEGHVFGGI